MSQYYEFFCPVKILAGLSALDHLAFELSQYNVKNPLILTDSGVKAAGLLDVVLDSLNTSNMATTIYDNVPPDSSFTTVSEVAQHYQALGCDAIVAVGGGSVIDTAKATNILVSENAEDLRPFAGAHKLTRPLKPLIIIPTTAGTGSEVTSVAVISDNTSHTKVSFLSHYLLPNIALLDPRMTQSLPPKITVMTAMDALTHAIEAYLGLAKNPMSDAYAVSAIRLIADNLLAVLDTPTDSEKRLALAQASTMAGIAFSNSMVGLVHSLGHATGAVCGLPHGQCMSIYLPFVLEFNQQKIAQPIGELLLPLAGTDIYAKTPESQRADKVIETIQQLKETLHAKTGLARTLSETGKVTTADFDTIANKALDDGSIIYNVVETDKNDILALVQKAF